MDCTAIREAISPKTLNKFTFALAIIRIVVGATLCTVFAELEISESRYDMCDFIHGKCDDEYRMQNHKLGIPPYLFVIVNVLLLPIVTINYSQYAKSTVNELEGNPQDSRRQPRNQRRTLFMAYLVNSFLALSWK